MRQSERSLGASTASALGLLRTSNIAAISCHRWQPAGHLKQRRWRNRDRLCEERHSDACGKLGRPERPVAQVSSGPAAPTSQAPHRHVRTSAGGSGARPNLPQPADWQGSLREGRARPGSHARPHSTTAAAAPRRSYARHRFGAVLRGAHRTRASSVTSPTHARGGWSTDLPRFHLRENISRADEELTARIADAPAPFWRHVREALAERHP